MTNYKLTTDLIVDCMALIPHNLERLNNQHFNIEMEDENSLYVNNYLLDNRPSNSFSFFSHCLRTIPEFQVENPEIQKLLNEIQEYEIKLKKASGMGDILHDIIIKSNKTKLKELTHKTIASATLHGQGEFPPSTLEELCESYKNVMSK